MKKLSTQEKRKKLRAKADKLYQEIGKMLYKECLICGGSYSCLHHYHPKSTASALRYILKNGIPICQSCHCRIHSSDSPTLNNEILKIKGMEWAEDLETIKRNTFVKTSLEYYENIINNLRKIYGN